MVMAKHSECLFATQCSVKIQVAPGSPIAPLEAKVALLGCAPGMCMYSSQPDIVCVFCLGQVLCVLRRRGVFVSRDLEHAPPKIAVLCTYQG